jgi:predicted Zn-dependent protease
LVRGWLLGPEKKTIRYGLLAFAKASALEPDSPLIRTGIALAFFELGDRTTAVALAQALVHSSPGDASAWLLLGDIARRSCLWEQALAAATRAFELDPDNYNIMFLYAVLLGEFGRLGEQRELFERYFLCATLCDSTSGPGTKVAALLIWLE